MKKQIYTCDRCKIDFDVELNNIEIAVNEKNSDSNFFTTNNEADICDSCMKIVKERLIHLLDKPPWA